MHQWYVVRTKPRQEQIAHENLLQQGFRSFYPQLRRMKRVRGNKQLSVEALFPCYLFISLDLGNDNTSPIRSTRGVTGLLKFGTEIRPVPDNVITAIQNRSDEFGVIDDKQRALKPGQKVRIGSGTMQGMEAIFKQNNGNDRAVLLMNIMGAERAVIVPVSDL